MHNDVACLAWSHLRTRVESSESADAEADHDHDHVSNGLSKLLVLQLYLAGKQTEKGYNDGMAWPARCLEGIDQ
jgi:hypothetical protein